MGDHHVTEVVGMAVAVIGGSVGAREVTGVGGAVTGAFVGEVVTTSEGAELGGLSRVLTAVGDTVASIPRNLRPRAREAASPY